MIITGLDFGLIITLSYLTGIGTGIAIIFKYKDNILIKSRSRDNLSTVNGLPTYASPVIASSTQNTLNPSVTKITLE